jgi:hypothetical protein
LAFLKKKESFLNFFYFKGFLHHAAPAAPVVHRIAGRSVPRLHLLVVLLHGHAAAVLLLHVLAALEFRAECHLPLLRNGVAARHLVVVLTAAHLLLVLVATHARLVGALKALKVFFGNFACAGGVFIDFSPPGSNDFVSMVPGANDNHFLAFLKKKESLFKCF